MKKKKPKQKNKAEDVDGMGELVYTGAEIFRNLRKAA
jgi:hypothetical protein